ncbi:MULTISPECIES: cobyrinate a,c-diamide synthase [Fischerella]|uniref:Cobyrinate a,c-diamide synthase n=1 Tax=Fischerella muscicola CCMEE 5323 TaxID=2019572 RepID=A0A2N6JZR4_FISMU|nr:MULTISPECIES: cobyrinate a,c-diamide synthase [Fischerella]MBD2431180.1 cobyrinate a,c-diamide synthase [Fischerella sp. FACHB-380]PLZ86848.1 cobyrinate a,c-diamide synthase [Fischerella muscicola CCMEE 5323]
MPLIIAGERSGVGKTTVTLTLLASLCRRSQQVQSFKVGPDYIDPMFHQHVTGRACRNLDPILTSPSYVQQCFARHSQGVKYALVEGVMGLFDGVSSLVTSHLSFANHQEQMTDYASTAHIARLLDLPVVLVIDCSRLSGSVAAIAHGYSSFDPRIKIAGVILNRVGSDRHLQLLKDSLAPLQLPILGVLRRQDNITIPDRHLGLVPTAELPQLNALIDRLADLGDLCFDWERLLPLLQVSGETLPQPLPLVRGGIGVRIAVARDRAFNFYYQDNLDLLQQLGAELVFWSPLEDAGLPEGVQGMYFGGGFPEVFAQQLAENTVAKAAIKTSILSGMPTIAECGGLMYLCEQIVDFAGKSWAMVGVLPTTAVMSGHLTLGYRRAVVLEDSFLVSAGTTVCGHEFHRSYLMSNFEQPLFQTYRFDTEESTGYEGWGTNSPYLNLHASYIHMHWGACTEIPERFLRRCLELPVHR